MRVNELDWIESAEHLCFIVDDAVCWAERTTSYYYWYCTDYDAAVGYHEPPDLCHRLCSTPSARSGHLLRLLLLFAQIYKVGNVIFCLRQARAECNISRPKKA